MAQKDDLEGKLPACDGQKVKRFDRCPDCNLQGSYQYGGITLICDYYDDVFLKNPPKEEPVSQLEQLTENEQFREGYKAAHDTAFIARTTIPKVEVSEDAPVRVLFVGNVKWAERLLYNNPSIDIEHSQHIDDEDKYLLTVEDPLEELVKWVKRVIVTDSTEREQGTPPYGAVVVASLPDIIIRLQARGLNYKNFFTTPFFYIDDLEPGEEKQERARSLCFRNVYVMDVTAEQDIQTEFNKILRESIAFSKKEEEKEYIATVLAMGCNRHDLALLRSKGYKVVECKSYKEADTHFENVDAFLVSVPDDLKERELHQHGISRDNLLSVYKATGEYNLPTVLITCGDMNVKKFALATLQVYTRPDNISAVKDLQGILAMHKAATGPKDKKD